MIEAGAITVLVLYTAALAFIFVYSLVQLHLVLRYRKFKKKGREQRDDLKEDFPFVTVQLPIFNERYVIERLIDAVSEFDYPKDRFEIQVLDDSTDETVQITAAKVKEKADEGIQIYHVRREDRSGFKAGALQAGLKTAKGKYIAIFDADFLPPKEFLKKTVKHFTAKDIGVVQTRWGHINKDYSILTKLQAFALDAHFTVEQQGRNAGGYFINFNGTAGVWRKSTIEDAGGWQSDTLTEDLDLSYRAQLKGWRFVFLEEQETPAELPAAMDAIKSQQFRWTKGAAETAKKNLWSVLKQKMPAGKKIHAIFHLLNSTIFVCVLTTAILSVPLLLIKANMPKYSWYFDIVSLFILSLLFLVVFFWTSRMRDPMEKVEKAVNFVLTFPIFLSVSMGLSLHNALAVLEGYIGKKTPFIRTPKFAIKDVKDNWTKKKYVSTKISFLTILEGILTAYFAVAIGIAVYLQDYSLIPFHALLTFGFGLVFYFSVRHARMAH